jgi:hypothetical protein
MQSLLDANNMSNYTRRRRDDNDGSSQLVDEMMNSTSTAGGDTPQERRHRRSGGVCQRVSDAPGLSALKAMFDSSRPRAGIVAVLVANASLIFTNSHASVLLHIIFAAAIVLQVVCYICSCRVCLFSVSVFEQLLLGERPGVYYSASMRV